MQPNQVILMQPNQVILMQHNQVPNILGLIKNCYPPKILMYIVKLFLTISLFWLFSFLLNKIIFRVM